MTDWPKPLQPVAGPFAAAKIDGAVEGMGAYGDATRALAASGLIQPDMITGMTLFLIARQPRRPRADGEQRASGVAGGVWVREQYTIHRPIDRHDAFVVTGENTGAYTRKGRGYSTTASRSHTADGEPFATNLTTGLLSYRADPSAEDSIEESFLAGTEPVQEYVSRWRQIMELPWYQQRAFYGKPKVRAAAHYRIDHGDLTGLLYMQGYHADEIRES